MILEFSEWIFEDLEKERAADGVKKSEGRNKTGWKWCDAIIMYLANLEYVEVTVMEKEKKRRKRGGCPIE